MFRVCSLQTFLISISILAVNKAIRQWHMFHQPTGPPSESSTLISERRSVRSMRWEERRVQEGNVIWTFLQNVMNVMTHDLATFIQIQPHTKHCTASTNHLCHAMTLPLTTWIPLSWNGCIKGKFNVSILLTRSFSMMPAAHPSHRIRGCTQQASSQSRGGAFVSRWALFCPRRVLSFLWQGNAGYLDCVQTVLTAVSGSSSWRDVRVLLRAMGWLQDIKMDWESFLWEDNTRGDRENCVDV